MNCGACGNTCLAGVESCSEGVCQDICDPGLTRCDDMCVNLANSRDHCGACGNACTPGQACENGVCGCGTATVSFSEDVEPILTQNCATTGCHRLPAPKESLILTAGDAYFAMVGVPAQQCGDGRDLVSSGDPAASYLMDKLLGTNMCFGSRMPKQTSLSDAEIATISNWICIGAPNN